MKALYLHHQLKVIAIILSFFIFCLAITPCSDARTCDADASTELIGADTHDHSTDEHDACTPFCTCQCCGITFTFSEISLEFETLCEPNYPYIFDYSFNYQRDYLDRIWHPPAQT
jgi:hypothetical protein